MAPCSVAASAPDAPATFRAPWPPWGGSDGGPDARRRHPRAGRAGLGRRAARAAARAAAVVAAARVRQRRRTTGRRSRRPACTRTTAASWPTWPGSRSPPRRTCATTTRSGCSRCRASRCRGCTPPPARRAGPPSSATPPRTSRPGSTVMARSIRAAGGRPGDRVHVAYGYGLFTGGLGRALRRRGAGLHGDPGLRRDDRAAGAADRGLRAGRHHGDAVVHARDRRRDGAAGRRPARDVAAGRHLRRRAVDRRDARARSRTGSTCTPSTSTGCPR